MAYLVGIATLICIYCILAASLNLIAGYGGIFHMGHGGFFAVGAYAAAMLAVNLQLPFLLELLIAGLITGVFGLLIGLPAIRLQGDYITLASYAFAVVVYTVASNWVDVTRGPVGIAGVMRPQIFGLDTTGASSYLGLTASISLICLIIIYRITDSPYGKTVEAIREDQTAAFASGKNVARFRVEIFVVGALFAGVAGTLYAHYMSLVDPSGFSIATSSLILSMVVIGGMASMKGSIAGAVIVILIPELLRMAGLPGYYAEQLQNVIYSLLLLLIVKLRPSGLFGRLKM